MLYLIWFHWMRRCDGDCVGAAGKTQGRGVGGLEGPGWRSSGKLQGGRGWGQVLQMRGSALLCSVCTVDSDAVIDAGWRLGHCNLGLNPGFEHVDDDTRNH